MRKMKVILIAILMMFCLMPVSALTGSSSFVIRAYKSVPDSNGTLQDTVLLTIYDALTGTLNALGTLNNDDTTGKTDRINVLPYMNTFLTTDGSIKADNSQVLFSYLVTGSVEGIFQLTISLGNFVGPCSVSGSNWTEPAAGAGKTVQAYFQMQEQDINYIFPSVHNTSTATHVIESVTSPVTGVMSAPGVFTLSWNVHKKNSKGTAELKDIWSAEGAVKMAIDKASFDAASKGAYKSDVVVTLTTVS